VEADKNSEILEKQLKILGKKIRIDILKKLNTSKDPLSFSMLQKEVLASNSNSTNFSFHLKTLKESKLIDSNDEGYSLNLLGTQILKRILSIEQVLNDQNKTIMIRTSKYSKEPFNADKIEDYLIKEGQVELHLAKKIAHEVEDRLLKTNIQYLTAPLMREYINAVLLENGLEEVRHKLTRLGTPPFEVYKLFNNNEITPKDFLYKLGSDVSEQFLLLNLLPKDLADLYLSGEIALLNLNYWSLRPLSFYVNISSILNFLKKHYSLNFNKLETNIELTDFIMRFFKVINKFSPYLSEDLLIGDFNNEILPILSYNKETSFYIELFISHILKFNQLFHEKKPHLSLDFSLKSNNSNYSNILLTRDFLKYLIEELKKNNRSLAPFILFDKSFIDHPDFNENDYLFNSIIPYLSDNLVFYNKTHSNLLNSTNVNVKANQKGNSNGNKIILDKILINLHSIALHANQNDNLFYNLLEQKLSSVFEFFVFKEKLIRKKLNSSTNWSQLTYEFFEQDNRDWIHNSLKIISFFGLNQAIKTHCGIELDRIKTSEKFALKVLALIRDLVEEKNSSDQKNFLFSQPHYDKYLYTSHYYENQKLINDYNPYSMDFIRKDSNLPVDKRISLFKKFEKIIKGGVLFNCDLNSEGSNPQDLLKLLINSGVSAFSFRK